MTLSLTEDIRSVTDLKRKTKAILTQIHETGRPVVLTVNGKADAVLIDAKSFEKYLSAANLARLLAPAEAELAEGKTRSFKAALKDFKHARKL